MRILKKFNKNDPQILRCNSTKNTIVGILHDGEWFRSFFVFREEVFFISAGTAEDLASPQHVEKNLDKFMGNLEKFFQNFPKASVQDAYDLSAIYSAEGSEDCWREKFSLPKSSLKWLKDIKNKKALMEEGAGAYAPKKVPIETRPVQVLALLSPISGEELFQYTVFNDCAHILTQIGNTADGSSFCLAISPNENFLTSEGFEVKWVEGKFIALIP